MPTSPKEDSPKVPPQTLEEAAASAIDEIKQNPSKFIFKSREVEILKGNQHPPGGWLHGPAQLQMFRAGYNRLVRVGEMLGEPVRNVRFVRIARMKGTKKVYIWPAEPDTPDAIPITGTGYQTWINLLSLLGNENSLPTRRRERYALKYTEAGPEGVALVMDLGEPLEVRIANPPKKRTKKASSSTTQKSTTAGATPATDSTTAPGSAPTTDAATAPATTAEPTNT